LIVNYEGGQNVEIFVAFGDTNDERHGRIVESDIITERVNSKLVSKVHCIVTRSTSDYKDHRGTAIVEATESEAVAKIRDTFLNRVRGCPGVIKGACWALNRNALREVLEAV
jgi:hypothetical protein